MARKCTCKICKAKGNTELFFKVTDQKGKNTYYCSESEYENFINEKNKRKELLEYVAIEVLNYEEGQIVNPIMVRKISELHKFYDYEVIQECFKVNLDSIQYWMNNKNFTNEYGMVSYIMKIIEGNINDIFNSWKHKQRQQVRQSNETINLEIINDMTAKTGTKKKDDILSFLDEEDI